MKRLFAAALAVVALSTAGCNTLADAVSKPVATTVADHSGGNLVAAGNTVVLSETAERAALLVATSPELGVTFMADAYSEAVLAGALKPGPLKQRLRSILFDVAEPALKNVIRPSVTVATTPDRAAQVAAAKKVIASAVAEFSTALSKPIPNPVS